MTNKEKLVEATMLALQGKLFESTEDNHQITFRLSLRDNKELDENIKDTAEIVLTNIQGICPTSELVKINSKDYTYAIEGLGSEEEIQKCINRVKDMFDNKLIYNIERNITPKQANFKQMLDLYNEYRPRVEKLFSEITSDNTLYKASEIFYNNARVDGVEKFSKMISIPGEEISGYLRDEFEAVELVINSNLSDRAKECLLSYSISTVNHKNSNKEFITKVLNTPNIEETIIQVDNDCGPDRPTKFNEELIKRIK